ncbi:MAG TPA: branched-chain amino acid aminotransferase [Puia sp.]|jgi:branched-chain amino acid aminotransferase|nr:branched-chain amino acid aminotransferase [Puia sp.]
MIETLEFPVTRVKRSRLTEMDFDHLPFGKYFSDHMLEADYVNGAWKQAAIRPYQPVMLEPSIMALHYGQAIFEGIKAYRDKEGRTSIFRPLDNFRRFNISADRMEMPAVTEEIFIEGMRQLVALDREWIPAKEDYSLYIRPFMFATDAALGVRPSDSYKFMILLSPTGPYYAAPMKIYVEEKYTRAAPGGVGFAKNAGNYGASLKAAKEARAMGYDQVLWTDAAEHKWLQEVGTMNVFFVFGDTIVTPSLEEGTILAGVTRDSVITVLREQGYKVEERKINIEEVVSAHRGGKLTEIFGSGTAATISYIKELKYKDYIMTFDVASFKVSPAVKKILTEIREGKRPDPHGWLMKL